MENQPVINLWLERLQSSGYRVTHPRRVIVELLAESQRALGPIELFDMGRAQYPGLGLVTVYRTLEKLEELGMIQKVHFMDGCHRYLRASHGHEHMLLCTRCGRVVFFDGDDLQPLADKVSQRTGFEIDDHWLQFFGLCPNCAV